jgi:hypothetical protein
MTPLDLDNESLLERVARKHHHTNDIDPSDESKYTRMSFWRASLYMDCNEKSKDTFLSFPGLSKGHLFINGFNVGRYWPRMGPQETLYIPAPLLKGFCKENTLLVMETDSAYCAKKDNCFLVSQDYPVLNGTTPAM